MQADAPNEEAACDQDSKIQLMLGKSYAGMMTGDSRGQVARGQIPDIPWKPLEHLAVSVAKLAAEALGADLALASVEPLLCGEAKTLHAGMLITLRGANPDQHAATLIGALQAYAARIQDVSLEAARNLAQAVGVDADAIALGFRAAEDVRRNAPGSNLTGVVTIRVDNHAQTVTVGPKIGRHPDPETDLQERPYYGRLRLLDDDGNRIEVSVAQLVDDSGAQGTPTAARKRRVGRNKKVKMQFDARHFSVETLAELMVSRQIKTFVTMPKLRGGRERLSLLRIE
jgi:hypothetical protein